MIDGQKIKLTKLIITDTYNTMTNNILPLVGKIDPSTVGKRKREPEVWEHIPRCCRAQVQLYGSTAHLCNQCLAEMRKMLRMPNMIIRRKKGRK